MKTKVMVGIVMVVAAAVFIGMIVLISFPKQLSEGIVVDKDYRPPQTHIDTYGSGNDRQISSHTYPASYAIKVKGYSDSGEMISEWWTVTQGKYSEIAIGDQVYWDEEAGTVFRKGVCYGNQPDSQS